MDSVDAVAVFLNKHFFYDKVKLVYMEKSIAEVLFSKINI